MQVHPSAIVVERELAVVVGEGALGHDQVAELHIPRIAGTDADHDGDARLALLRTRPGPY